MAEASSRDPAPGCISGETGPLLLDGPCLRRIVVGAAAGSRGQLEVLNLVADDPVAGRLPHDVPWQVVCQHFAQGLVGGRPLCRIEGRPALIDQHVDLGVRVRVALPAVVAGAGLLRCRRQEVRRSYVTVRAVLGTYE